jgi:hypothetical protein
MARQLQWVAADGTTINLTDRSSGYRVLDRTTGLTSPSYELSTSRYAGIDGAALAAMSALPRDITLAMLVEGADRATFRARVAQLVHAMRPKAGLGQLVATDELGRVRRISCYYKGGLEGTEQRGEKSADRWWKASVQLWAPSPWFNGDTQVIDFGLGAPTPFFPIFPLVLSPSNVQGQLTVDLTVADGPSYPVWTVTGPGSALTLTNLTTGGVIQVNAAIGDGQTMIIDTRQGFQSVRRGDGTNLMGALASDPTMWPLADGVVNQVSALLTGANASSRIRGSYAPQYAGI